MGEMIERVAKAIAAANAGEHTSEAQARILARAAIEAMKITDTVEGVPGGIAFEDAFFGSFNSTVFHAMTAGWNSTIDAALSRSTSKEEGNG